MKVLVVSPMVGTPLEWATPDGVAVEAMHAPTPAAAIAPLQKARFDAVVIDAQFLMDGHDHADVQRTITELRTHAQGAAMLALTAAADRADPRNQLILVDGAVPRSAPPHVQSQILYWAAERARLGAALANRNTRLRARDHELEQSRARFRDVIERNADAIVVVDATGTIRFANRVATELLRRRRDELLGTSFGYPLVAGETTELDLYRGGEACVVEMRVVESEWEGEEAYIASLRDITERRSAEESARRLFREQTARAAAEAAAQRFRFLAEASTLLASSLDHRQTFAALAQMCVASIADWVVIYVTNERGVPQRLELAHRDPSRIDLLRRLADMPIDPRGSHPVLNVVDTHQPSLVASVDDAHLDSIAQGPEHRALLEALGTSSYMLVPLIARDRCLGAIALVAADDARRFDEYDLVQAQDLALRAALAIDNSRLYRDAQEANRAKTDLLAVISHDLRTPMNAIIGYAELLEMGIPERLPDGSLEHIGRIRASGRHLLYLIDELLSYARLDAGHEETNPQDTNAAALARDVAAVMEPIAQKRNLRFTVDADREAPLRTDPDKLRQVLINLASNAVKYTESGEIVLQVRTTPSGDVVIRVTDTGVGISDEHLSQIFEPFWQVTATRGTPDGGTGLGLSVVRRLVQLLGGDITVQSTVGDGSTFTVTLPADAVGEAAAKMDAAYSPDVALAGIN